MKKNLLLMIFVFSLVLFGCDATQTDKPKDEPIADARIVGLTNETIDYGQLFNLLTDVKAYDYNGTNITGKIEVEGNVDVNTAGEYTLTYTVTGENEHEVSVTRLITVLPEPLDDAKLEGVSNKILLFGQPFNPLFGVNAYDYDNSDISSNVIIEGTVDVNTPGTYVLIYKITGENGVLVTKERTVTVKPNKPKVKLLFPTFEIHLGEEIDLLFCITASSDIDGDISSDLYVKDDDGFDNNVIGEYTIIYAVKDSTGVEGTNRRVITVNP